MHVGLTLPLDRMERGPQFRAFVLRDSQGSGAMDPVLGVDHAWMSGPTFPPHPHQGFSAVSYVFADAGTGLSNRDSIGTRNLIRPGGLHWTAAGRGIVHEEVPIDEGREAHLFQIFVNLPAARRDAPPYAISLEPEAVPVIECGGASVRVPLGSFGDVVSPLETPTQLTLLDIRLDPDARCSVPIAPGSNAFVIPVAGTAMIDGAAYGPDAAAIPAFPARTEGQSIMLAAQDGAAQVAVFAGPPIAEQR